MSRVIRYSAMLTMYGRALTGGEWSIPLRAYETDLAKIGVTPAPGMIAVQKPHTRRDTWTFFTFPQEDIDYATVEADGQVVWDSRTDAASTEETPAIATVQTGDAELMPYRCCRTSIRQSSKPCAPRSRTTAC
jgi:hypothetical protein